MIKCKMKMINSKKGQKSLTMGAGFIFFNLLLYILIASFAMDDEYIGRSSTPYAASINDSTTSESSVSINDLGFFKRFTIVLFDLPWFLSITFIVMQAGIVFLVGYGLIRGL